MYVRMCGSSFEKPEEMTIWDEPTEAGTPKNLQDTFQAILDGGAGKSDE